MSLVNEETVNCRTQSVFRKGVIVSCAGHLCFRRRERRSDDHKPPAADPKASSAEEYGLLAKALSTAEEWRTRIKVYLPSSFPPWWRVSPGPPVPTYPGVLHGNRKTR